jgi:carbon-monoxide dehydrogenase large subunit
VEDPRLVAGKGSFVDDIHLPHMLYASVLRSFHAHAFIRSIDVSAARSLPGVVAVLTGEDIAKEVKDLPTPAMRLILSHKRPGL